MHQGIIVWRKLKRMWLKLSECKSCFEYLKKNLDPKWLETQFKDFETYFSTPKNTQILGPLESYHPLGRLLFNVEKRFGKIKEDDAIPPTEDILKAAKIGQTIYQLKNSNTIGLENKIKDLMSTNHSQFEKTLYELDIAKLYSTRKHKIEFLQTSSKKTPDLCLDDKIELECKNKDVGTKEQRIQRKLFEQLVNQSHKYIRSTNEGFLITIQTKYLTQKTIKKLISNLISLVKNQNIGSHTYLEGKIILSKLVEDNQRFVLKGKFPSMNHVSSDLMFQTTKHIIEQKFGKDFWHKIISENKHFVARTKISHSKNNDISLETLDFFILDSPYFPTKYESVISSIKKAKKQLSGKKPGIIFVNMDYHPETVFDDFSHIELLVNQVLKQNQSISLIVVTTNIHLHENGKIVYYYDGKSFFNINAKFPISQEFEIFGNLKSPIHTPPVKFPSADPKIADSSVFSYVCLDCRNKIFVQAKFSENVPLLKNYNFFPKSNILKCPYCDSSKDLAESKKLIEETTGKKII